MPRVARLSQAITLHLRTEGPEDEHGNPTVIDSDRVVPGLISQQFPQESGDGIVVGEGYRLYLNPGDTLEGWDACTIDSLRYEVIGAPWPVHNPRTASVHHVEVNLRRAGTS